MKDDRVEAASVHPSSFILHPSSFKFISVSMHIHFSDNRGAHTRRRPHMRRTRILLPVALFLVALSLHAQCGVERWTIKTGTDSQAPSINLGSYISTTIYNMRSSTAPGSLPATARIAPRELNQYQVSATLTKYVREGDSDYHLVIQ